MKRWDVVAALGMSLPAGIVIGLYIYIGSFNRMLGDDYCTMYQGQHLGLFRSIWFWYLTWHGGFSASAADWLLSLWGARAFPFHTFAFLSAWVVFAAITANTVLQSRGYSSFRLFASLLLAVLLVFTTLSLSPDIIETVFWWGGARGYLSPLILFTLYPALYLRFIHSSSRPAYMGLWLLLSFGFVFLVGGFTETFTPVLVVLMGGLTVLRWLASRFNLKDAAALFLGAGFSGALVSLFVMVLAPGNAIRQESFPAPPGVFSILGMTFASYFRFLADTFGSPATLTAILGAALGAVWLGTRMNQGSRVAPLRGRWIAAIVLTGLILAFGCFPPAVYGTSEPAPPRTLIVPAFLLVFCLLAAGFAFGEWLAGRREQVMAFSRASLLIGCVLVLFSSYGSSQTLYAMREEHASFAQKWDQVDARIREAKSSGQQQVDIPPMQNWADAAYPGDNLKNWVNLCYTKFYDINVVAPPR